MDFKTLLKSRSASGGSSRLGKEHPRTLLPARDLLHGFRLQVSVFGFRFSGFGVRVSGFGFQAPDSGFRASGFGKEHPRTLLPARDLLHGFRFRDSGAGFQVSSFGFRVSGFGLRVLDFRFRASGSGFQVSGFGVPYSGQPLARGEAHALRAFRGHVDQSRALEISRRFQLVLHAHNCDASTLRSSTQRFPATAIRPLRFRISVSGFQVLSFGSRVSGFGLRCSLQRSPPSKG